MTKVKKWATLDVGEEMMEEEVTVGGATAVSSKILHMCTPGSNDTQSERYQ